MPMRYVILIVISVIIKYNLGINRENFKYSTSPNGDLSIMIQSSGSLVELYCHPNDNNQPKSHAILYAIDIDNKLKTIEDIFPIDVNHFFYLGIDSRYYSIIGFIQLEWITKEFVRLIKLNSTRIEIASDSTKILYDNRLPFNIYLFSNIELIIYDLNTYKIDFLEWNNPTINKYIGSFINMKLIDEKHLLIASDEWIEGNICSKCPVIALVKIDFNSLLSLSNTFVISFQFIDLTDTEFDMLDDLLSLIDLSVNHQNDILIGLPEINRVVLAHLDIKQEKVRLSERKLRMRQTENYFGYSVCWINNREFAVISLDAPVRNISNSLVFIFNLDDENLYVQSTFPNNRQMIISFFGDNLPYLYRLFLFNKIYLGIIGYVKSSSIIIFMLPLVSLPGMEVRKFDEGNHDFLFAFGISTLCPPGTYKSVNDSIGPCLYCPEGRKASIDGSITCEICSNKLNCPLGSINDDFDYDRIIQNVSYPESSDSNSFEDIILSNIFTYQCILLSPIFWMSMVIVIVILLIIIIWIISVCTKKLHYRWKIFRMLEQIDLIGEGNLWIGGIASSGIFVIIIFVALFSYEYLYQYPIEETTNSVYSCNPQIINAKFTRGLQLLALPKSDEERPIFQLLDDQPFTLIIDLINTVIFCTDSIIAVRQYSGRLFVSSPLFNCSVGTNNSSVSLTISVPTHITSTQIDLDSSILVGSIRICLKGETKIITNGKYNLRQLFVCEIFSDGNHSLSPSAEFDILLTKAINRTESLNNNQFSTYSALWIPVISSKDATTKSLILSQDDEYLRYLQLSSLITIRLSESQFYIENKQEPIARKFQILFNNVLFLGVIIELFRLTFLISKLLLLPIIRFIYKSFTKYCLFNDFKLFKKNKKSNEIQIDKTIL